MEISVSFVLLTLIRDQTSGWGSQEFTRILSPLKLSLRNWARTLRGSQPGRLTGCVYSRSESEGSLRPVRTAGGMASVTRRPKYEALFASYSARPADGVEAVQPLRSDAG